MNALYVLAPLVALLLWAWSQSGNDLGGLTDMPSALAQAIAKAEGFFSSPTALPARANNPGDLKAGDQGSGTIGGKTVFASIEDGWAALEHQLSLIFSGRSGYYTPDMTIAQMAETWTGQDNANVWASTVAGELGVSVDTPLNNL